MCDSVRNLLHLCTVAIVMESVMLFTVVLLFFLIFFVRVLMLPLERTFRVVLLFTLRTV